MVLISKILIIAGIVLIAVGVIVHFSGAVPWIGRLPGDILIKKEKFTFYFPLTTCALISILLSLIFILWSQK